jgi:hypothetical protein
MELITIWSNDIQLFLEEILPKDWNLFVYQMINYEEILLFYQLYHNKWHLYFTHFFIIDLQLKGLFNIN